jgi:hypothetical protein
MDKRRRSFRLTVEHVERGEQSRRTVKTVHVILDNYAAHKHPRVRAPRSR